MAHRKRTRLRLELNILILIQGNSLQFPNESWTAVNLEKLWPLLYSRVPQQTFRQELSGRSRSIEKSHLPELTPSTEYSDPQNQLRNREIGQDTIGEWIGMCWERAIDGRTR